MSKELTERINLVVMVAEREEILVGSVCGSATPAGLVTLALVTDA